MADGKTRREFLLTLGRTAGLLGLGGLVVSAASRSAGSGAGAATPRLPCEQCPALRACSLADSLQARDAVGVRARPVSAADGGNLRRLCASNGAPTPGED